MDDKAHLRDRYNGFCQKCQNQSHYWEVAEIFLEPKKEMEQMNLSFCPSCASEYRHLRYNHNLMKEFADKIRNCDPLSTSEILLNPEVTIKFLQTHLAEIQTILLHDPNIPYQSDKDNE